MTSTPGTVVRSSDFATITFERSLPHNIEVVWAGISEPTLVAQWLAPVHFDPRVDGRVELAFGTGPDQHVTGRILVWEPLGAIEHEWRFPGETQSVLRYELTAHRGLTTLELTHRRLGLAWVDGYAAGWHAYLDRLAAVLDGVDVPDWDERVAALRPSYR